MVNNDLMAGMQSTFNELGEVVKGVPLIKNKFWGNIMNLTTNMIKQGKIVKFVMKNGVDNRGAVNKKGMNWSEKAVVNACNLRGIRTQDKTLLDEVALYRGSKYGLSADVIKSKKYVLMADYLLSTSLCYVELFGKAGVGKYFATRNKAIIEAITGQPAGKYAVYLSMNDRDIRTDTIKLIKIAEGKDGVMKATQPRAGVRISDDVSITPTPMTGIIWNAIEKKLRDEAIEFSYIKDNRTVRNMVATLNKDILMNVYRDEVIVNDIINNVGAKIERGYVKLPEVGLSKYDRTGVRALNITRIIDMKVVRPEDIDLSCVDVDIDSVLPTFIKTCDMLGNNMEALVEIYRGIFNSEPQAQDINVIRGTIQEWARRQSAIGTTTFAKGLHKFMLERPFIFIGYTGRRVEAQGDLRQFNFGMM